ncbi:GNAT family N-acetyltransferase [Bradyrhizobium jicamae]|nr:GNAT family N-acetyltransferase [Bradyrhizobium jicamae]MBR0751817.1 GNAT family N-acetyltransferase [Bradyrhizobium jicamae]
MTERISFEIRLLSTADAPMYRLIRLESLQQNPEAFSSSFERESQQPLAWFEERLTASDIFGAFGANGDLLGVAGFRAQEGLKTAHKATVWGMYVRGSARGTGIGRLLMETIIAHAEARVEQLQLEVVADNQAAIALYQSLGFAAFGHEVKALKYDGRYFDELLMVKFF